MASIVDFMKSKGMDSSFGNRSKLAAQFGIKGYRGTASQNLSLLSTLQKNASRSSSSHKSSGGSSYKGPSVVDYLKSVGKDSSYGNRSKLAAQFGISGYRGTASQNDTLLSKLKSGGSNSGSAIAVSKPPTKTVSKPAPAPSKAPTPTKAPTPQPQQTQSQVERQQAEQAMANVNKLINTPFSYDPNKDPAYQAAKQLSDANTKTAMQQATETMNDRGILNSTITSDRLGQISQSAANTLSAMVPQLEQQAKSEYQQKIADAQNYANTLMGQSNNDRAYENTVKQQAEQKREYDQNYKTQQQHFAAQQAQNTIQNQINLQKLADSEQNSAVNNQLKQMATMSNADYHTYLESQGIDKSNATKATNNAIAQISKFGSKTSALGWLNSNASKLVAQGVDIQKYMDSVSKYFGSSSSKSKSKQSATQQASMATQMARLFK